MTFINSPQLNNKNNFEDLAVFGGTPLFSIAKSTSNLLQPDVEKFLNYSKTFINDKHYTNNGPNIRLLEERLANFHNAENCVMFSSGFWALALAIKAIALEGKNEIIMPSLTYRRMPDIAAWLNMKPHFCEVDPDSLAMTAETVSACINDNTALILGVHPIVNCADVEELTATADEHKIPLLFDSVESVFESINLGKVGSFGAAECFSLHACKLLNGFGGGYLTTNDTELAIQLASMRTFGFKGADNVAVSSGLNAKLNEMHAAMTLASLDDLEIQVENNRQRYYTYKENLHEVDGIRLLEFDENYRTGYKNIVVELLDTWPLSRQDTITLLNAENILARAHYSPPLHKKKMDYPFISGDLSLTEKLSERYLNLPCGQLVSNEDIRNIIDFLSVISLNAKALSLRLNKVSEA